MTLTLPVIQPDALREPQARKPAWLKVRAPGAPNYMRLKALMRERNLHTVCEEARCPNIGECWEDRTATFMILGDVCTRRCGFCAVAHGRPEWEDWGEPDRVGRTVAEMGLAHVVVTSVNRDDLADGGAEIFARTITAIRREAPSCRVEVLIPDFQGVATALETVLGARPDVLNHNIETVPRLYRTVRPGSRYERSLELFGRARRHPTAPVAKSGIMLGLGESLDEVRATMADLQAAGVQLLTLGQYLRPSAAHLPVARYVPPAEFEALGAEGHALGFRHVEAGPLVRSSYHAKRQVEHATAAGDGPVEGCGVAGGAGRPPQAEGRPTGPGPEGSRRAAAGGAGCPEGPGPEASRRAAAGGAGCPEGPGPEASRRAEGPPLAPARDG